jgi:hypothetical protein
MLSFPWTLLTPALAVLLMTGIMPSATWAADLSQYRGFRFGTDLSTVSQHAGVDASQAKVIHRRPALIQELAWHPQPLGLSSQPEAVKEVAFSFYQGGLFQIVVDYDRSETEGLTAADFADAISVVYVAGVEPATPVKVAPGSYGEEREILGQWQDSEYRFDLIHSPFGPTFRLVGVHKRLEAPVLAAALEAKRLYDQEAPQRDAARLASEEESANAKLEKARVVNKPKFRP